MQQEEQIAYKKEFQRKSLHLCSLIIPVIYWFLPSKYEAVLLLLPITAMVIFFDTARHYNNYIGRLYNKFFGSILRSHEQNGGKRSGATPLFISSLICIIIFPKIIAVTALSILAVSDTAAALIGRKWGKHKFFGKSLEGTLAFAISGILCVYLIQLLSGEEILLSGSAGVTIAALFEVFAARTKLDDNFTVPISAGTIMFLMTLWQ